ncbi:hypothetical protein Pryu01_00703 [Paraliobacillus ryukyuensis]|uniref:Competence protein ComFC n=1 Tax=Paraliobacillus ryukyuensis TaxID=200904 RepID=A0A366EEH1_9BACI|nr:ComF family protein [Paraliobacillus ryukyuensis]RBP00723.1 competence protein ComFC [Paraliobacillus ryukyuensis]
MTNCLWCNKANEPNVTWKNFFIPDKPDPLCTTCRANLQPISKIACTSCGRPGESVTNANSLCRDCERWQQQRASLLQNRSVYPYNETMQAMIAQWKYRGDYCLIEAFQEQIRQQFSVHYAKLRKNYILVPIPLSRERLHERAFNQAEAIAKLLPFPSRHLLARRHGEKQSKKSRKARIASPNPFQLVAAEQSQATILLVDDVYTTGATLHHAASLLNQARHHDIFTFTLAR